MNAIIYIGIFEPTFNPLFKKLAVTITAVSPSNDDNEDILLIKNDGYIKLLENKGGGV